MNAYNYRSWINSKCGNCVTNWSPPTAGYDPEDTKSTQCGKDDDNDGVINRRDNCPGTANADQANCNVLSDPQIHADGKLHGDVCDKTPCAYIQKVHEQVYKSPYATGKVAGPAEVFYRGVGSTTSQTYLNKPLEARYCSCNDPNSPNPYSPVFLSEQACSTICKINGKLNFTVSTDQGWQYAAWTAHIDNLAAPALPKSSCTLYDDEGDGHDTECRDPVDNRLFRKPYAGSSISGKTKGDWDKFWNEPKKNRSRYFTWDWQKQDFPHPPPPSSSWTPPNAAALPTFNASAHVWFRPKDDADLQREFNNRYTDLMLDMGYFLLFEAPEELLIPLRYQVPETVIMPGPPLTPEFPSTLRLVVHPLAAGRPAAGLEDYLWDSPPTGSATIGLVVYLYNPTNGDMGDLRPSVKEGGTVLNTTEFSVAQWHNDELYVFGGRTLDEGRPATLWRGIPVWDEPTQRPIYHWDTPAQGGPAGRTGAIFAAAPDQDRLVLIMGETATGVTGDAWSYGMISQTWTQETLQVPGLLPVTDAAHAARDGKLYIYGGRDGTTFHEGLYEVDLATLSGQRVDLTSGPGARSGAALRYLSNTRTLYLYGGRDDQGLKGDLWAFDLDSQAWTQVSSQADPGAPPPMERAAIGVCAFSGAMSVLSGQLAAGSATEPVWRLRHGGWQSHSEITDDPR